MARWRPVGRSVGRPSEPTVRPIQSKPSNERDTHPLDPRWRGRHRVGRAVVVAALVHSLWWVDWLGDAGPRLCLWVCPGGGAGPCPSPPRCPPPAASGALEAFQSMCRFLRSVEADEGRLLPWSPLLDCLCRVCVCVCGRRWVWLLLKRTTHAFAPAAAGGGSVRPDGIDADQFDRSTEVDR